MRWILILCAVLLHQLVALGQVEDCPRCPKPTPKVTPAAPQYEWRQSEEQPEWFGLFLADKQVGAYNSRTQRIYILDPATDKWIESAPASSGKVDQVGGTDPVTNGVVRGMIQPDGERFTINGRQVTSDEGRGVFGPGHQVPDDAKTPSLTLIGPKDVTAKVRQEMESSPVLGVFMKRFLIQEFEPSNPLVSKAGFKINGNPVIYAEQPDGRVLFRLNDYPGDKAMIRTVVNALASPEGIRKPDPDYHPASDPGLMLPVKPQINAEVTPAPWVLVLTHLAAFAGGGGLALGGGLLIKRVVSGLVTSLVTELQQKQAASSASSATTPRT